MEKQVKIITHEELITFINSDEYLNSENIPISPQRAISYINNKRAKKESPAILMLMDGKKIIAYRCLFEDKIFTGDESHSFFWISGSWVHPEYRRQGLSLYLLEKTMQIAGNNLMYSNYAPESKALYDKSGYFKQVVEMQGKRYYFRSAFSKLLPPRINSLKKTRLLWEIIDFFLNIFIDFKLSIYKRKISKNKYEEINYFTDEIRSFISKHNIKNPFKRNIDEFINFIEFPWVLQIKTKQDLADKYYFSFQAKTFLYKKIIIRNENNQIKAFFIIKIRDSHLTIPYFFADPDFIHNASQIILSLALKNKISYLTVFNENLIKEFNNCKKFTLHKKPMLRDFYASHKIFDILKQTDFELYDGDGDNAYT